MDVILVKNVDKLGYANEIVSVKPGYGRNFLIPQGYAVLATPSARKAHEEVMRQKAHKETKQLAEAQELAGKIAELTVVIATKAGDAITMPHYSTEPCIDAPTTDPPSANHNSPLP